MIYARYRCSAAPEPCPLSVGKLHASPQLSTPTPPHPCSPSEGLLPGSTVPPRTNCFGCLPPSFSDLNDSTNSS